MIRELVDDEIVAALECRMHGFAFDDERLRHEEADGDDDDDCENDEGEYLLECALEELHVRVLYSYRMSRMFSRTCARRSGTASPSSSSVTRWEDSGRMVRGAASGRRSGSCCLRPPVSWKMMWYGSCRSSSSGSARAPEDARHRRQALRARAAVGARLAVRTMRTVCAAYRYPGARHFRREGPHGRAPREHRRLCAPFPERARIRPSTGRTTTSTGSEDEVAATIKQWLTSS
jgi:hypothetical protein